MDKVKSCLFYAGMLVEQCDGYLNRSKYYMSEDYFSMLVDSYLSIRTGDSVHWYTGLHHRLEIKDVPKELILLEAILN